MRAGFGYAAILLILFHGLLDGNILSAGAHLDVLQPFNALPQLASDKVVPHINWISSDPWLMFEQWQEAQYGAIREGGLPTWNPDIYAGAPLHANFQSAFLNPFHWIYFIADPAYARGPMAALRLWISAMALLLLLRRYSIVGAPAFIGGCAWMLSSFNIRWLPYTMTNATLWLPVLLLAVDSFLDRPDRRRFALAALATTVLMLAGHPGAQVWVSMIAAIYVGCRLGVMKAEGAAVAVIALRIIGCFAILLVGTVAASAALLPFVLELRNTVELGSANRGTIDQLPIQTLLLFISPDHFGRSRAYFNYTGPVNYNEIACWFGLPTLALALAAIIATLVPSLRRELAPSPRALFLPIFAIVTAIIATSLAFKLFPIYDMIVSFPLALSSSARRMFLGVHFAGAILAAIGASWICARTGDRPPQGAKNVGAMTLSFLIVFVIATAFLYQTAHKDALQKDILRLPEGILWQSPAYRVLVGTWLGLLSCAALGGLVRSAHIRSRGIYAWSIFFAATVALDLLWPAFGLNPIAPREIAIPPRPPILDRMVEQSGEGRIAALWVLLPPNISMRYGYRDARGFDLPQSERLHTVLMRAGLTEGGTQIDPLLVHPALDPVMAAYLDRTSTRRLLSSMDFAGTEAPPSQIRIRDHSDRAPWTLEMTGSHGELVYVNPNADPRTYMPALAVAGDSNEALSLLLDPAGNPPQRAIFEKTAAHTTDLPAAQGTARITRERRSEVVVEASSQTGGLVVLNDRMAPGWNVDVDGIPAEPLTANYWFRGVVVAPGPHEIRWHYSAPGLRAGLGISFLTVVTLGILAAAPPKRGAAC